MPSQHFYAKKLEGGFVEIFLIFNPYNLASDEKTVAFTFNYSFFTNIEHASGFGKVLLNQPALN